MIFSLGEILIDIFFRQGSLAWESLPDCPDCKGKGNFPFPWGFGVPCDRCGMTGKVFDLDEDWYRRRIF